MLTLTTARLLRFLCLAALVSILAYLHPLEESTGRFLPDLLVVFFLAMCLYLGSRIRELK